MTIRQLALRYAVFSVVAIICNLAVQRAILVFDETASSFVAAVCAGTIVGLVIKYEFDRRWIFYDAETGLKSHGRKFVVYTAMGVFTTAIFWTTETVFWLVWRTDTMRELGAVIGLSIGYMLKYYLDCRFVFTSRQLDAPS
jgi:putative flippase GtrA